MKFMDFYDDDFFKEKEFVEKEFIDSLGSLDDISSFDILEKISSLNFNNRKVCFNNHIIKNKLRFGLLDESKDNQWYYYRKILKKITVEEFLSLYDADFLNNYFSDSKSGEYLSTFFAAISESNINSVVKCVFKNNELFYLYLSKSDSFESLFCYLDYELLKEVIYKLQEDGSDFNYDFFVSINEDYQYLLLKEEKINDDTLVILLNSFYYKIKSHFFMNDSRALYLYTRFNIPFLVKNGVKFSDDIICKKEFFESLKSQSFIEFRENINNTERSNNPVIIEERLEQYYNEILSSYSSSDDLFTIYKHVLDNPNYITNWDKKFTYIFDFNIFDTMHSLLDKNKDGQYFFNDRQKLEQFLKKQTSMKLSEIIIDALFRDNIYNVWININEMLRFNGSLDDDKKILDDDRLNFYNMILNFDNISSSKKIDLYNNFKNKNINLMFYEDLRKVKDFAYDKINDSIFNINKIDDNLKKHVNKMSGVDVYDLRNSSYKMLVRTQAEYRDIDHYRRNCYSIISDENTSIFGEYDTSSFLYGYNEFDNEIVLHMFERDSYSSGFKEQSSKFVNRIMTADELVRASDSYSEIQLVNLKSNLGKYKFEVKKPDFIVVFDVVRDKHVEEAKRLSIPIVIITKKILDKDKKIDVGFDNDLDVYVNNYFSENEHRIKR